MEAGRWCSHSSLRWRYLLRWLRRFRRCHILRRSDKLWWRYQLRRWNELRWWWKRMGWRRKLICSAQFWRTRTNNHHSNRPGIPVVAALLPTSLAVAEHPATAAVSTLLLPVSTPRLPLAPTVTSPRLVRTRAAASQRHLRRIPPRHQVVMMAQSMISWEPRLCTTSILRRWVSV